MREIDSIEPIEWLLWLGLAFFTLIHLRGIYSLPGLHFDEAWAMNFAWRIALEKGFWPLHAMSPYTAPWAHYWAAIWIAPYPSLAFFRLSQILLSIGAVWIFTRDLWKIEQLRAASYFPFVAAFLPGLYLNHRFAVELNGLHPFLFALFFRSLIREQFYRAAAFFVIATTAHILFYGIGLGLLVACLWEKREFTAKEKRAIGISFALLALFFLRVAWLIPEKGKASALVLSALVAVALPFCQARLSRLPRWPWLPPLLAAVFLVNLVFFAEGTWSLGILTGEFGFGFAWQALLILPLLGWLLWEGLRKSPAIFRNWFYFSVLLLGIMMLKPAPRYFEIPLLAMAGFISMALAWQKWKVSAGLITTLGVHAMVIYSFFFNLVPHEEDLRFLHFKDSSRDFLSKQKLAEFLGGAGCELSDIKTADSRVQEALAALWLQDWWVARGGCSSGPLRVSRSREAPGKTVTIADFVIEGTHGNK